MNKLKTLLIGALLLLANPLQAAMVTEMLTGTVDFSNGGFGLSVGDTISATVTYDNAPLTGSGIETLYLDSSDTVTITVGLLTFDETQYIPFPGDPDGVGLAFNDGQLEGLLYFATFPIESFFDSFWDSFSGVDNFLSMNGTWDSPVVVPVPAAFWLFAPAVLGLGLTARRSLK